MYTALVEPPFSLRLKPVPPVLFSMEWPFNVSVPVWLFPEMPLAKPSETLAQFNVELYKVAVELNPDVPVPRATANQEALVNDVLVKINDAPLAVVLPTQSCPAQLAVRPAVPSKVTV